MRRWRRGTTSGESLDEPQSFHEPRCTFAGKSSCSRPSPAHGLRPGRIGLLKLRPRHVRPLGPRQGRDRDLRAIARPNFPPDRPGTGAAAGRPSVGNPAAAGRAAFQSPQSFQRPSQSQVSNFLNHAAAAAGRRLAAPARQPPVNCRVPDKALAEDDHHSRRLRDHDRRRRRGRRDPRRCDCRWCSRGDQG